MSGRLVWGAGVLMFAAGWATAQPAGPSSGLPAVKKSAVPAEAAMRSARKLANDFYGGDIAKAKTNEERAGVAKKILQSGIDEESDRGVRYVMLSLAADVAAGAADIATTMTAVDLMAQYFEVDALKLKADALAKLNKAKGLDASALNDRCTRLIDECMGANRYDVARKVAEEALSLANRAGDKQDVQAATAKVQDLIALQAGYEPAQKALAALSADPGNAPARLTAGRFFCLTKGDWARGLPLLAGCTDKGLRQAAEKEKPNPTAPAGQVEVGDAWWDLSENESEPAKRKMREHAAEWYAKASGDLTGTAKLKVRLRLEQCPPTEEAGIRWTVIFRSADPSLWNTDTHAGADRFALPLKNVSGEVKYVRVTLVSTKASVIVAAGRADLEKDEGGSGRYRWNGSNKFEFGANHLGVIDLDGGTGQGKVEVGYSRAGWGFGHQYEVNDRQAWAWAGVPLSKSVFEFAVTTSANLSARDRKVLLGGVGATGAGKVQSVWRRPFDGAWFVLYQDRSFRHYNRDYSPRDGGWDKGTWRTEDGQTIITSASGGSFEFSASGKDRVVLVPPKSWPQDLPQP